MTRLKQYLNILSFLFFTHIKRKKPTVILVSCNTNCKERLYCSHAFIIQCLVAKILSSFISENNANLVSCTAPNTIQNKSSSVESNGTSMDKTKLIYSVAEVHGGKTSKQTTTPSCLNAPRGEDRQVKEISKVHQPIHE